MKTKNQIKKLIEKLEKQDYQGEWKILGFTPYNFHDVLKTLKWVLKNKPKKDEDN